MWKTILNFLTKVFTLSQRVERQEQVLRDLQQDFKELSAFVERLDFKLERASEREASEREKFMLRVENQLLKASRQLPTANESEDDRNLR